MTEKFDFKKFVLSWTKKPELKNVFWILFASYAISIVFGEGSLAILATIIAIYVGWKYTVNEITVGSLKNLKFKPAQIGIIDYIKISIVSTIAAILPWWTGLYFVAQIAVFVAAIILTMFNPIGYLLFFAWILMLVYNSLRLNLTIPAYLLDRNEVTAVKTSWQLTEGNIIEIIKYVLRSLWYTITNTWIFLLLPLAYGLILLTIEGGILFLMTGRDLTAIRSVLMILGVIVNISLSYSITFEAITSQYASAAMYSIFSKK